MFPAQLTPPLSGVLRSVIVWDAVVKAVVNYVGKLFKCSAVLFVCANTLALSWLYVLNKNVFDLALYAHNQPCLGREKFPQNLEKKIRIN